MTYRTDADDPTAVLLNSSPPPMAARQTAFDGLSVRDYFAAAALQGVIAAHAGDETALPDAKKAAKWARKYADQLLAELADHAYM